MRGEGSEVGFEIEWTTEEMERVVGRSTIGDEDEANDISAGLDGDFGSFDSAGTTDFDEEGGWGGLRGGGEGGGSGWAEEHLNAVIDVFACTHESFPNKNSPPSHTSPRPLSRQSQCTKCNFLQIHYPHHSVNPDYSHQSRRVIE